MFACMEAWMKIICTTSLTVILTQLITSWVGNILLPYVKASNLHSFKSIPPPLIFLLFPIGNTQICVVKRRISVYWGTTQLEMLECAAGSINHVTSQRVVWVRQRTHLFANIASKNTFLSQIFLNACWTAQRSKRKHEQRPDESLT